LSTATLNAVIASLFFFIDCAVSEFAFSWLVSPTSDGWLAINAFFTATRLLIKDFFWIDIFATFLCVTAFKTQQQWTILKIAEATITR